jgi:hypothetical protein
MLEGPAQHELDLRVQTAQIGVGPALQRFVRRRIQPEQKWFPLRHDPDSPAYW